MHLTFIKQEIATAVVAYCGFLNCLIKDIYNSNCFIDFSACTHLKRPVKIFKKWTNMEPFKHVVSSNLDRTLLPLEYCDTHSKHYRKKKLLKCAFIHN